jgi:hypothetical protein
MFSLFNILFSFHFFTNYLTFWLLLLILEKRNLWLEFVGCLNKKNNKIQLFFFLIERILSHRVLLILIFLKRINIIF